MNDDPIMGLSPRQLSLLHAWVMAAVPEPLPDWAGRLPRRARGMADSGRRAGM